MVWTKIRQNKALVAVLLIAIFLRFFKLGNVPVSLFGDELDVGYQAYSLLKTGKDYSGNFLPLQPRSLAEWRTPIFIYSTIPTVAFFGITPLGVRLVPAFFGVVNIFLLFVLVRKLNKDKLKIFNFRLETVAAFLLTLNPWHIQYSRAAFEITEMLTFLLLGIILFLNSLENKGKYLWLSIGFLLLMPWTYNSPKLFVPLFLISLLVVFYKSIFKFTKINLVKTLLVCLVLGIPLVINIFSGQGSARFASTSVFSDANLENVISEKREVDSVGSRYFHNKATYFTSSVVENYLVALSPQFLFLRGDSNLRHSIGGQGMFYAVDSVLLLFGIVSYFSIKTKKYKALLLAWILIGILPSALTLDGATHATRLILILIPLTILMTFGLYKLENKFLVSAYLITLFVSFIFYQHNFWVHNPIESAKWWHYGWQQSVEYLKENSYKYDKTIISTKGEPPWIFFAAYSEFSPQTFQKFSPEKTNNLENFGQVSSIDNYYFASIPNESIYEWAQYLDSKTLYLATAEEVKVDLISEPQRTPENLVLLKSIAYPSGIPAFYIFTKK